VCIGYNGYADLFFEIEKRKGFFGTSERHVKVQFSSSNARDVGHLMAYLKKMIHGLTR